MDFTEATVNVTEDNASETQKLLSDGQFVLFTEIFSITCSSFSLLGTFGNFVVIRTFRYMGIKDGVTLSFVFLAVSDLAYLLAITAQSAALGLYVVEKRNDYKVFYCVDPFGIYIFLTNLGILLYLVTVLVTTFLAIARCLCVAMPLKFKNWFSRKTSVIFFLTFCTVSVASYLPILMYMRLVDEYDSRVNATRAVLWISPKREEIKQAVWISRDVFVTFLTQMVVIACVVILTRSLRTAAKFRHSATYSLRQSVERQVNIFTTQTSVIPSGSAFNGHLQLRNKSLSNGHVQHKDRLSSKDISVVQQVVLISTVYIVCNTPKIFIDITTMFVPEFTLGKSYQNLYLTFICVMEIFQLFNSSIGILIYYNYNSKFRKNCGLFL